MSRYKNLDELIDANINGKACMFAESKKYFISDSMVGFISWYLYMYGNDSDFERIIEKPYFYEELLEEYENDFEWHHGEGVTAMGSR